MSTSLVLTRGCEVLAACTLFIRFSALRIRMASTIPSSDSFNWIIGPVGHCGLYIGEETANGGNLHRAVTALACQAPMLELGRQRLVAAGEDVSGINRLIEEQHGGLEAWAREMIASDYDSINRHGLVGLWVAIEVAVEDTAALILIKEPSSIGLISAAGIKVPATISNPLTENDARRIYRRLETFAREGVSVSEGYCRLLSILGIVVSLPPDVVSMLSEINYVRNCLLHRGGIVDERATMEAPSLGLPLGAKIKISRERYLQYFDVVAAFSSAFLEGVIKSPYIKTK